MPLLNYLSFNDKHRENSFTYNEADVFITRIGAEIIVVIYNNVFRSGSRKKAKDK
jgi:hypothetical protein